MSPVLSVTATLLSTGERWHHAHKVCAGRLSVGWRKQFLWNLGNHLRDTQNIKIMIFVAMASVSWPIIVFHVIAMGDFKLPLRSRRELRSSGLLHSE